MVGSFQIFAPLGENCNYVKKIFRLSQSAATPVKVTLPWLLSHIDDI